MATFVSSNISAAAVDAVVSGTTALYTTSWNADAIKVALYLTTPDSAVAKNDTLAHNVYAAAGGQWVTGNEAAVSGNYAAGGTALPATVGHAFGTGTMQLTGGNPQWTSATIASVFGCLVYNSTTATKYAYCWNYFGGSQSVSSGTFTVVWSGSGILQFTLT